MNGVININKHKGITSFDAVSNVRKVCKIKKVGHTGTLDPMASGVLPICIGKATKIIDYIMDNVKEYKVGFRLGITTTTYDVEGEVLSERSYSNISESEILNTIESFVGNIKQVPPMYSALKQNGVRLYELARQGIEVHREARDITIYSINNIKINIPNIEMTVKCSKGTYIRSLCYDIGEKLNCGATMYSLERTQNGMFTIEKSIKLEELNEENINENIISIEEALSSFPKLIVSKNYDRLLINGVRVFDKRVTKEKVEENKLYRIYNEENKFLGLGCKNKDGLKMEKLLVE